MFRAHAPLLLHTSPSEAGACLRAACDGGHADVVAAVLEAAGPSGRGGVRRERRAGLGLACRRGQAGLALALLGGGVRPRVGGRNPLSVRVFRPQFKFVGGGRFR